MPESLRRDMERALEECREGNDRMREALERIRVDTERFLDSGADPLEFIRHVCELADSALNQD